MSLSQPELATARLALRPFEASDVDDLAELANDVDVARNTLNIPHPYAREDAESWIASHPGQRERGEAVTYAIVLGDRLVGAVGLIVDAEHGRAELGYWIGRPYWGRGIATEATRAVVEWGFRSLELRRIHAGHFPENPASGRVLQKLGMRHEGTLRAHVLKWGEPRDLEQYGLLREERSPPGSADP